MLLAQAHAQFSESILPQLPEGDEPMLSEEWSNYTDSLTKDGDLTALQYHHCPSFEDIDEAGDTVEEELEYLLKCLGLTYSCGPLTASRNDGVAVDFRRHFLTKITQGDHELETWFSQGDAWTTSPTLAEVFAGCLQDATDYTFEGWCDEVGHDLEEMVPREIRAARAIWKACQKLHTGLTAMFSTQVLDDLREATSEL